MNTITVSLEEKLAIAEHLRSCMNKEELTTRQVASFLNLNPCYISMALNQSLWDSMANATWIRLYDWHISDNCHLRIQDFVKPEEEPVWKKFEKKERKPRKDKGSKKAMDFEPSIPSESSSNQKDNSFIEALHYLESVQILERDPNTGILSVKEEALTILKYNLSYPKEKISIPTLLDMAKELEKTLGVVINISISNHGKNQE